MSTIKMPPAGDPPDPSTPHEPAPMNSEGSNPAHTTAEELFHYIVNESDQWQPGTAATVHALNERDALDYLLDHGPLRPEENRTLITAVRLLNPERFGPAV